MEMIKEYLDLNGNVVPAITHKVVAKSLTNPETKKTRYLIKMYNGVLFDPMNFNIDSKLIKEKADFYPVSPEAYALYVIFLRKKSISALRQAQRCI